MSKILVRICNAKYLEKEIPVYVQFKEDRTFEAMKELLTEFLRFNERQDILIGLGTPAARDQIQSYGKVEYKDAGYKFNRGDQGIVVKPLITSAGLTLEQAERLVLVPVIMQGAAKSYIRSFWVTHNDKMNLPQDEVNLLESGPIVKLFKSKQKHTLGA